MIAAASLDVSVYEEVEADGTATGQAALVVVLSAIASAIGSVNQNAIGGLIGALVGWAVWAGVTYFIGATLFKGTASWGELLRTLGFAQSPGLLYVVGIIPVLGALAKLVIGIWVLIAGVIAIRQALDISTGKAVATALLGWVLLMILMAVFAGSAFVAGLMT
ncbi:MAG TPA: YIP1 family protein [Longimicrobiales bacterium]